MNKRSVVSGDKRKGRRVPVGFDLLYRLGEPARLSVELGEAARKKCTHMLDISELGIAISSEAALPVGTELEITFHVIFSDRQSPPMEARGVVRYCAPVPMAGKKYFRLGIEFVDLTDDDRAVIADFIRTRASSKK